MFCKSGCWIREMPRQLKTNALLLTTVTCDVLLAYCNTLLQYCYHLSASVCYFRDIYPFNCFIVAMYVHHLGLYCILFSVF